MHGITILGSHGAGGGAGEGTLSDFAHLGGCSRRHAAAAIMFDILPMNCELKALKASRITSLMRLGSRMLNTMDNF